ncbi:MAG: aldo/keto reductase [Chloroflexota bacterium]|nr:MAG: aldo/keto reductase [Chloroflexota bacterium]
MRYRHLGNSGVQISVIGVGCNRIGRTVDLSGAKAIVHRALDEGINFFDTADIYGATPGASEALLSEAFAGLWDRIVVATKVRSKMGEGVNDLGASRYHIMSGVEASLRRLKSDHIDLYYIHEWDAHTPIQETLRALHDLVTSGKVRYIGASNFAAWQLARSNDLAEMRGWNQFVVSQEEYHMFERNLEREVIPYARYAKLGIVPYFPLAGGFLTGKYQRGDAISPTRVNYVKPYLTERNFEILDRLHDFTARRERTVGELAIAWLLHEPQVCSVISGATNADQISANAKASDWTLSAEEAKEVRAILEA